MRVNRKILSPVLLVIVIIASVLSVIFFLKGNIQNSQGNTTVQNTMTNETTGLGGANTTTAQGSTQNSTEEKITTQQVNSKKLTENINITELTASKNRNSIFYTAINDSTLGLYEASIDADGNISSPLLVDNSNFEPGKKGFWNLTAGTASDSVLCFSDKDNKNSVVFYDINSQYSSDLYSINANEVLGRIVLGKADDVTFYAKAKTDGSSVNIVSNSVKFDNENILYSIKPDSGVLVKWLDLSGDESKLLYCLENSKTGKAGLWILDISKKNATELIKEDKNVLTARWSKDGSKIVYSSQRDDGTVNICVYDFNSKSNTVLITGKNKNVFPDWSYYDDNILYLSEENGVSNLYIINLK